MREIVDKQELTELLYTYCRAIDRADEELLLSCYHPDALCEHGAFTGTPSEMVAYLRDRIMDTARVPGPLQHALTNILIDVAGDVAYGESYGEARAVSDLGELSVGLTRYLDRFERRDGEWKIISRRVVLELARPGIDRSKFLLGSRDRSDPSYERS